jgi:hypothetical protein
MTMFYLSHQCQICHNFLYFESILRFAEKLSSSTHMSGIDNDPDRPDPDRQSLDVDPDPAK